MLPGHVRLAKHVCLLLGFFFACCSVGAADPLQEVHDFNVPAGNAIDTLKSAARRAGLEIIFLVETVRNIRTTELRGQFTSRAAFLRMLEGTGLAVVSDGIGRTVSVRRQVEVVEGGAAPPLIAPSSSQTTNPTRLMKRRNPLGALITAVALVFAPARALDGAETAADAAFQGTGIIVGTVVNSATGKYLERAVVGIEGTKIETLTSRDGSFRLVVPAGIHRAVANYTDLDEAAQTVAVPAGGQVRVDLGLSAKIYELDPFVVSAAPEGTAYAINQQRRAESLRSVTSIDAFIDQTTGNPGEFLRNIQGIQMDYLYGEPQNIRVRGFDSNLTVITMDGNELASAASTSMNRVVQIDQMSIGSIGAVEVYKAPVPWMSANAIGGAVNFTSQSAFDQKGHRAFLQIGFNAESRELTFSKTQGPAGHGDKAERRIYPIGRFSYSNSFFNNRLGLMFSLGRDEIHWIFSSASYGVTVSALPGTTLPAPPTMFTEENARVRRGSFSVAPNRQLRSRDDISLNLDFKASDSLALFLKMTMSDYHSANRNHGWTLNAAEGSGSTLTADSTLRDFTYTAGNNRVQVTQGVSVFDKYTQTWTISPGMKFKSGDWKIDLTGGLSKSINHYRNPDNFSGMGIGVVSTTANPVRWRAVGPAEVGRPDSITQLSGPDFYDLNSYQSTQGNLASTAGQHRANHNGFVTNNARDSSDVRYAARLDVQRDFMGGRVPFYVKAGLSYNDQVRDRRAIARRWYWMGEDGLATADDVTAAGLRAGRFKEAVPITVMMDGWNLREPDYFDTNALWEYWQANPQVLQENTAYHEQQKFAGRQKVGEEITAAYAAANVTFDKLNVLTGLRVERTKLRTLTHRVLPIFNSAWETDGNPATNNSPDAVNLSGVDSNSIEGIGQLYRWIEGRSGYTTDPFPYLHLRYALSGGMQLRASYTEAIGRPNLSAVIPTFSQSDAVVGEYAGSISVNKVGLEPQRSKNLDFSFEYYTRTSGEFSIGWFNRDIKDYISTYSGDMTQAILDQFNLDSSYANYRLVTNQNLGYAKWSGVEMSFRQGLRAFESLPKAIQGFELWGNHTNIYQMEGDFGTPGAKIEVLSGVVEKLYNVGVGYRTVDGKLSVNLSNNYQSARQNQNQPARNAAGQNGQVQEAYQFWNLEAKYRITPRINLTIVGRNLTSERPVTSVFGYIRTVDQQEVGTSWVITTRFDF
jgi:iron complex outermembrane recepter protein